MIADLEPRQPLSTTQRRIFALGLVIFAGLLGAAAWYKPEALLVAALICAVAWAAAMLLRPGLWRSQLTGILFPLLLAGLVGLGAIAPAAPLAAALLVAMPLAGVVYGAENFGQDFYDRWLAAAEPLGWTFSGLVLMLMYYVVFTPVGLVMRLLGRDSLHRRLDPNAATYWTPRQSVENPRRYFDQF